jgi:flagellar motor switch protein FliG
VVGQRAVAQLSGPRKAAVLMAIIGEEAAGAICKHLSEQEIQAVTRELADIGKVPSETVMQVMEEYSQMAILQDSSAQGGREFTSRLLTRAFGDDAARQLLDKVGRQQELNTAQLDSLRKVDAQQLAKYLEEEHPQTITLVLAHLEAKQASEVLMKLPEQVQGEAVRRLAQLRQFSPEMAQRVSTVLNKRVQSVGEQSRQTFAGFKSVADLMNRLAPSAAKGILESIEAQDPNIAISVRNLMFTFEDILGVSDAYIREWLGALDKKTLALALKGASVELREHIFRAMSSRAVEMLKEDIETLGAVRGKDVSKAQQEAVEVLRRLESEGKVVLKAEGDDEYIV